MFIGILDVLINGVAKYIESRGRRFNVEVLVVGEENVEEPKDLLDELSKIKEINHNLEDVSRCDHKIHKLI